MKPFLKFCTKCRKQKWASEFAVQKSKRNNLRSHCRDCTNKYSTKHHLKHKFNMTEEDYELILKSQNGKCAICNRPETAKKQEWGY